MKFKTFRNAFISGLLILAPVGVTIFIIKLLLEKIGTPASKLFFPPELLDQQLFSVVFSVLSTIIVLLIITLLGFLSQHVMGRFIMNTLERTVNSIPLIRNIYNTVKQIIDAFSQQKKAVFQKVVLIEFPRKGVYAMGFLTGTGKGEVQAKTDEHILNIFLPTTPNPTSGYLVMVPESQVMEMDMAVTDGMKLIISGGAVAPDYDSEFEGAEKVKINNPKLTSLSD